MIINRDVDKDNKKMKVMMSEWVNEGLNINF